MIDIFYINYYEHRKKMFQMCIVKLQIILIIQGIINGMDK